MWLQQEEQKRTLGPKLEAVFTRESWGYPVGFRGIAWGLHLKFVIRAGPLHQETMSHYSDLLQYSCHSHSCDSKGECRATYKQDTVGLTDPAYHDLTMISSL